MYVIEIAPLGSGTPLETLSYFSSDYYPCGTILSIPVRTALLSGVVTDVTEASATKTALRAATFTLRKLPQQAAVQALPNELIETAETLAQYYASTLGSVLFSLLPNEIKKGMLSYHSPEAHSLPYSFEHYIFQDTKVHRHAEYQSLIREHFASHHSVHIVAPTAVDIDILITALGAGISKHTIVLQSGLSKKKLLSAFEALHDLSHPKLIITTPQYGFLERGDIRVVVLERSRAAGYRARKKPYIDYRQAYKEHARATNRMLISADLTLRSEDVHELETESAEPYGERPKRYILPGKMKTTLMVRPADSTEPFTLFSNTLLDTLKETIKKKGRIFLFAARRGLAPVVACVDCGLILRAPESGAPLSLHRFVKNGVEERWLICSVSGYRERAKDLCPSCGSWRLKERGIGIQHVYDVLKEHVDPECITLFDHTTARTHKKAKELIASFYKQKGSVLLGTTLALPYIEKPVSFSAVTSMDALRAIPSWKQQEEIFSVLLQLREKTDGEVLIQTRTTDNGMLDFVERGRIADFYEEELAVRKQFQYPPYAIFVHLTWRGERNTVRKIEGDIRSAFAAHNVTTYASFDTEKQMHETSITRQALIRVPKDVWPHDEIIMKLRALPPAVRIMIDPDRIV